VVKYKVADGFAIAEGDIILGTVESPMRSSKAAHDAGTGFSDSAIPVAGIQILPSSIHPPNPSRVLSDAIGVLE